VIGSVFASVYTASIDDAAGWQSVPVEASEFAKDGIGLAYATLERLAPGVDAATLGVLRGEAQQAFLDGLSVGCRVAAAVTLAAAAVVTKLLPNRPTTPPR
jgi:hypothetical protein